MALARRIELSPEEVPLTDLPSIAPGFARRALDVAAAVVALSVLAIPMLLVAVLVRLDSRGPALYRQMRIGQGGAPFGLIKFRTMRHGAGGSMLTVPGDPRITRIGRFLRAVAIDELPQLFNILRGHMTLVGPRPQTPGFAARYPEELREVFSHRPGLVGPGVLRLNDDDVLPAGQEIHEVEDWYLENIVPRRVEMDLAYLREPTMGRTIGFIFATLVRVPRRLLARDDAAGQPTGPELVPDPANSEAQA